MSTYPAAPTGRIDGHDLILERRFALPIAEVWASFTVPEQLTRWYGDITGERSAGHTITIVMTAEDGAPETSAVIVECTPPTSFEVEMPGMGDPWRLRCAFAETDDGTLMTFTHVLTPGITAEMVAPGWEFYADRHHAALHGNVMPDWESDRYQELLGPHYAG